jgi:hypothetical protein
LLYLNKVGDYAVEVALYNCYIIGCSAGMLQHS